MKLSDIVNKSAYCSIGCITKSSDIDTLKSYLLYNEPVISKFPKIVVSVTKTENITVSEMVNYMNVWKDIFGDKIFITARNNFGHTFGFTDLDKSVLKKSKDLGFEYAWKSTNDILVEPQIFDLDMGDGCNFFFLQGHGITGIKTYYNNNIDQAVTSFSDNGYKNFFPQTNFFITTTNTDELIDDVVFSNKYKKCISDPEYKINSIQTEYKHMLCESVLREYVERNKLNCKHLISKNNYKTLLETILYYNISDGSYKNIFFKECGICHYHFPNEEVIEL